jgi:hypothetical protein
MNTQKRQIIYYQKKSKLTNLMEKNISQCYFLKVLRWGRISDKILFFESEIIIKRGNKWKWIFFSNPQKKKNPLNQPITSSTPGTSPLTFLPNLQGDTTVSTLQA